MRSVYYLHLLGATVWVGGLLTMAALIPAARRAGASTEVIRAVARRFGMLSWVGMGILLVTGLWQAAQRPWTSTLSLKAGLVGLSVILALWHSLTAGKQRAAVRGAVQGIILLLGLAIVWLATGL